MIQSQTVTPPFAAIEGTTFRLKTATTKRRTRSQRPRTRLRCGASGAFIAGTAAVMTSSANFVSPTICRCGVSYLRRRAKTRPLQMPLVPGSADVSEAAFLLRFREGGRDFLENAQMLVDVRFGVLHGDG